MAKKTDTTMNVTALVDIVYGNQKHTKESGSFVVPFEVGESWTKRDNPIAKEVK